MAYGGPGIGGAYSVGPSTGHVRVSYKRSPNFLERVGGSVCGSVVGAVLIVIACTILFLNEGRSVHTYNMLVETEYMCNPLKSADKVYPSLDNKLIFVSGKLSSNAPVEDDVYGVSGDFIRLKRQVEMYQWFEETSTREYKEPDGSIREERRYQYNTMWRKELINSNNFDDPRGHHNPNSMPLENEEWTVDRTTVGQYALSREAVWKINNFHTLHLSSDNIYKLGMRSYANKLYSNNPRSPQVGDFRVTYMFAGNTKEGQQDTVSVVGKQSPGHPGPVVSPYITSSGDSVLFLYTEPLSMEEVFSRQHASNQMWTWFLRGLGWLLTVMGFNMVAGILTTLVDWIPIVRELVSLSVLFLSVVLGSSLTLVVVAIAWLRYHPLYGLAILAIGVTPFIASHFYSSRKVANKGT